MSAGVEPAASAARLGRVCGHCGLPARPEDSFCCYGCELAAEIAREAADDHAKLRGTMTFALILTMGVMMFSLFLYAEDVYEAGAEAGLTGMRTAARIASVVLALPVMFLCGVPLARHAGRRLAEGQLSMSALIVLGAFSAYGLSLYSVLTGGAEVYLDSAATSLVLATLGRYLEAAARSRASGLVGIREAGGSAVRRRRSDDALEEVEPALLQVGDLVEVPPERVVPADLRLTKDAEVDLGVLSGESAPVVLLAGQTVPAGAVPVVTGIEGTVLRLPRESTVERLSDLARTLRERPSRLMRVADTFARSLTPAVWALALGSFAYWSHAAGFERGVIVALSVVLVACPCSYAIATPLVHWLAMRRAMREGVLVRNAQVLERLARVDHVAFDKTGTLTAARLGVGRRALAPGVEEQEVAGYVRALEADSTHPVARALLSAVGPGEAAALSERRFEPGRGVSARDASGRLVRLGKDPQGDADVVLEREGQAPAVRARFYLEEELRPEAPEVVRALIASGVTASILSGDRSEKAERVARSLGLPFLAGQSPEDKVHALERHAGHLAMVGDGLNDAPALAGSTSFAMAGASGLSRGLAQVNLQDGGPGALRLIPFTLDLSRRAVRLVRRLLIASTTYNLVFLVLALAGALRPVWAGLSMLIASLLTLAMASGVSRWPGVQEAPRPQGGGE